MRKTNLGLVLLFVNVIVFSSAMMSQQTPRIENRSANPLNRDVTNAAENAARTDHATAIPSVQPPPGWKACPRCQNATDRTKSNAEYQAAARPFNPKDLSGVWGFDGVGNAFNEKAMPALTDWGKQQHEKTIGEKGSDGTALHSKDTSGQGGGAAVNCDPAGYPRLYTYNYGFEFVMLPDRVIQFFELTHTFRTIWTDGRKLPDNPPEPRWLGWNVGHWEGDTLVVESNGYDDRSWLHASTPDGGWPHSDEMRVVERYRRLDDTTLESQLTVIDAKTYKEPWVTAKATTKLVPGAEIGENFCAPSDYSIFNDSVFLPVSGAKKK